MLYLFANEQDANVVNACVAACKQFIAGIHAGRVVLLDSADEIRAEYAKAVAMGRPYQLGSQFLLHVLQHQYDSRRVRRVDFLCGCRTADWFKRSRRQAR